MLGDDTFRLRTPFEDFVLKVDRFAGPPNGEQVALARRVMSELRFGLGARDPRLIKAAQRIVEVLDGGASFGLFGVRELGPSLIDTNFETQLLRLLEDEFARGRLVVQREQIESLSEHDDFELPELPPLPPPRRESSTHTFEVRFVDEIGKAISGIDAEFTADGAKTRSTNAAGIALVEGIVPSSADVAILDPDALSTVLDPRWQAFRPGAPPKETNTQEVVFRGAPLGPFDLKAELPNTVVIKPPLGKIFAELWDKTGRVRHANRTYEISGPQSFEGTTDDDGRLLHKDVFPGDYQLSLALDFFEEDDPDRTMDVVDSPLVVIERTDPRPEVRMLGVVPRSVLARLQMFFNTNKSFLLPSALPSVRKLRRLYLENAPCKVLVVGHADTRAGPTYNDKLSLERAEATVAYLKDDVETWFKHYNDSDAKKCWGKLEDRLMIISMPDFVDKPKGEDAVRWYQRTRKLEVDGKAGKETRHALITEYMGLDGASLSDFVGEIDAVAHGCGENFPLDDSGQELDPAPADEKRDRIDRRVELFFFDVEFGITPPPPGPNSTAKDPQYPLWRKRVESVVELEADDPDAPQAIFGEITDTHFRTNSAAILPEGEAPDTTGDHPALTSIGIIAQVLRFNEEHTGKSILVAGHTDTKAEKDFNKKLSQERAQVAVSLLKGGSDSRSTFAKLCNGRHTNQDINQILSWVSSAIPGFDCDPGKIDSNSHTAANKAFQTSYNAQLSTLTTEPTATPLAVDGTIGELTWRAFFDCYEFALRDELGEDEAGLATLRSKLTFVDPQHEFLGFGELFPIEEMGVDEFESQTNRRVQIHFFDSGEEPDIQHAIDDPETSELYLPGHYAHMALDFRATSAKVRDLSLRLLNGAQDPLPGAVAEVSQDELKRPFTADAQGFIQVRVRLEPSLVRAEWKDPADPERTFFLEFFPAPGSGGEGAFERLHNVGYSAIETLEDRVRAFQADFGRQVTGDFNDIETELTAWHDGGPKPVVQTLAASS